MKSTFTRLLVLSLTLFLTVNMWGQTFPYKHGFENATENSSWTMVADNHTSVNKWVIGTATSLTPTHSLYVSYNDGANTGYNEGSSTVIMAYRSLTIPAGGTYSVFLDYRNYNVVDGDVLYVCWVDDPSVTMPTNTGGVLPSWVTQYAKTTETISSAAWKSSSFVVCGGTTGKLVFVWQKNSTNLSSTNTNSVIAIDNIQINRNTHNSYYTGFDTPEEIEGWTLHNATTTTNRWTIGSGVSMSNPSALYISNNNNNFYYDGSKEGFVSAVKEIVLPAGEIYNIEFEYIVGGDANDYMYVSWLDNPTDTAFNSWSNNTNLVSHVIRNNAKIIQVGSNTINNKTPAWTHGAFQVIGKGRPAKLVFYWVNNSRVTNLPAAAIDNLTIRRGLDNSMANANPLPAPCATPIFANIASLGGAISVTWDDDGSSIYQIAYRNTYDTLGGIYRTANNIRSPYIINGLTKGAYSIFLRKVCDDAYIQCGTAVKDTSAWASSHQHIILTGEGCINYGDLSNPAVVTATYGSWSPPAINQAFQNIGVRPNRHKVITKLEYDPNTVTNDPDNPGLLTIPYGELASVKLGNDQIGAECEGLTYNLTVNPDYSLLIMKYAIVLQDPDHTTAEQPRFRLELLDGNGNEIDPTCGKLLFIPGYNTENWTYVGCGSHGSYDCVKWKNWSTIGLNLENYIGQTIKIRLSTWDCSQTGHYGYAYFMLNCVAQNFTGFSCDENSLDTIYAPDGFAYCWYKKYRPDGTAIAEDAPLSTLDCLSTQRGFMPESAADTTTYVCRITLKTEQGIQAGCFFNLTARLAPRIPEARQTHDIIQENCQNWVQFNDASVVHIGEVNSGETEPTIASRWVIRQNNASGPIVYQETDRNPRLQFPEEGGTYHVTLTAIYSNACRDILVFTIVVPPVGDIIVNESITTCVERLPYRWRGRDLTVSGEYTDRIPLGSGCDSIYILNFTVAESIETVIDSTICQGESVMFEGELITTAGTYTKTYPTSVGCDSVVKLNLTVNPVMQISITPFQSPICADDPQFGINYTNAGGSDPTKYTLTFNNAKFEDVNGEYEVGTTNDIVIPIPIDIRPDLYSVKIDFVDDKYNCEGISVTVPFEVSYKSGTIEQNWSDVIAVLNQNYNGGYQFSAYQWYKNGQPIEGETKSYLYIADGLEVGADYNVHLTRIGEDYAVFTCPIKAQPYAGSTTPNFVTGASPIRVYNVTERARVNIYTTTGVLVSSQIITPENAEYTAPSNSGVYIVNMLFDSGIKRVFKIVVGQ